MPFDINIPEGRCDVCGSTSNLSLRNITQNDDLVHWLCGYSCQECRDSGKEDEYVEKLEIEKLTEEREYATQVFKLNELKNVNNVSLDTEDAKMTINRLNQLEKNQEARDQLAERFQKIISDNESSFIDKHGPGIKDKHCKICGGDNSYLCYLECQLGDNVEILDAFTGYYCSDCIIAGKQESHTSEAFSKQLQLTREIVYSGTRYIKATLNTDISNIWMSFLLPLSEQEVELNERFSELNELKKLEKKYEIKAKRMKNARFSYEGIPVKMSINFNEGSPCYYCHKTIGKACKCKDTYYRLLK